MYGQYVYDYIKLRKISKELKDISCKTLYSIFILIEITNWNNNKIKKYIYKRDTKYSNKQPILMFSRKHKTH